MFQENPIKTSIDLSSFFDEFYSLENGLKKIINNLEQLIRKGE